MTNAERLEAVTEILHTTHLDMWTRLRELTADGTDLPVTPALAHRYPCLGRLTRRPVDPIQPVVEVTEADWKRLERASKRALDDLFAGLG